MQTSNVTRGAVLVSLIPIVLQVLSSLGIHITADCVSEFWTAGAAAAGSIALFVAHNKAAGLTPITGSIKQV